MLETEMFTIWKYGYNASKEKVQENEALTFPLSVLAIYIWKEGRKCVHEYIKDLFFAPQTNIWTELMKLANWF